MGRRAQAQKVHDRIASDLPINSRVAVAVVDDPYSISGEKISVIRSLRDDPLADMFSRGVIDKALFEAGRKWQRLHEYTEIGPIGAIDPGKEAVDGGRMRDPITDKQIDAFREIGKADMRLGQWGSVLIRNLLAERMTVGQMCELHGCKTGRRMNFLSMRVRECLEDLAVLWGFAGRS
jgi:hypothetical protein